MSGGDDIRLDGSLAFTGDGVVANSCRQRLRRPVMEVHLVRGSPLFESTAAAADADEVIMDAAVWSKMPEEMMWEVVPFLPAAKLFQLQLVSRKWRQELTSAHFRVRRRLTELSWQKQQRQQERVLVCVSHPKRRGRHRPKPRLRHKPRPKPWARAWAWAKAWARPGGGSSNVDDCKVYNCKVLEVDLSFVPTWFWSRATTYIVVAAGHGLVCISNENELRHKHGEAKEANRYCVLNPLTRTCIVLPAELPFEPQGWFLPTSTMVAIWSKSTPAWRLATYDLASGAGAAWVWSHDLALPSGCERSWWSPFPGPDGKVEVSPLDAPSGTLLSVGGTPEYGIVVAHRGAVYSVAEFSMEHVVHGTTRHNAVCGLWRMAFAPDGEMKWEKVALLNAVPEIQRLTGYACGSVYLNDMYAVQELVCFQLIALDEWPVDNNPPKPFEGVWLLGFNLDTLQRELVSGMESRDGEWASMKINAMELCPDFSLAIPDSPQIPDSAGKLRSSGFRRTSIQARLNC